MRCLSNYVAITVVVVVAAICDLSHGVPAVRSTVCITTETDRAGFLAEPEDNFTVNNTTETKIQTKKDVVHFRSAQESSLRDSPFEPWALFESSSTAQQQEMEMRLNLFGNMIVVRPAMVCLIAYMLCAVFNIWYARRFGVEKTQGLIIKQFPTTMEEDPRRVKHWDILKFIFMFGVILFHFAMTISGADLHRWIAMRAVLRPVVPCFVFISGIFGANVSNMSLCKAAFYPWANVVVIAVMLMLNLTSSLIPQSVAIFAGFNGFGFWYLWAIMLWRFTVSPLYHICGKAHVPKSLRLLVVYAASVLALNALGHYSGPWLEVWRLVAFYAPLFAAGLHYSVSEWTSFFSAAWTGTVSCIYITLWYALFAWKWFRSWNLAYCADDTSCKIYGYGIPNEWWYADLSPHILIQDLCISLLRLGVVIATVRICFSLASFVCLNERLAEVVAGWGSRSIFAYILHHIALECAKLAGLKEFMMLYNEGARCALIAAFAFITDAILSSQGTARVCRWLVIPPWTPE